MGEQAWVGDPRVRWTIALEALLDDPVDPAGARSRLRTLPWPTEMSEVQQRDGDALLMSVTGPGESSVRAAYSGRALALGAEHLHCDGLGLLAVLATVTGSSVASSAKGVGERQTRTSGGVAARQRLREVLLAPPATVAHRPGDDSAGEAFAQITVPGRVQVAELTYAAVRAVQDHNRIQRVRSTRIAVAIGASRLGGAAPIAGDHSALLRLRNVDVLSLPDLRAAIRAAAPEPAPPGSGEGSRLVASAATIALGVLSRRLGSTLLVSHLGEVTAPGVASLAFYPVTGGGSGVSLGAVGLNGTTTITLRGRRRRHDASLLAELASRVRDALPA